MNREIKLDGDIIELSGARVMHVKELLDVIRAVLENTGRGLSQGEKMSSFSFDVKSGEWTISVE